VFDFSGFARKIKHLPLFCERSEQNFIVCITQQNALLFTSRFLTLTECESLIFLNLESFFTLNFKSSKRIKEMMRDE
jgi:hypothetical protein